MSICGWNGRNCRVTSQDGWENVILCFYQPNFYCVNERTFDIQFCFIPTPPPTRIYFFSILYITSVSVCDVVQEEKSALVTNPGRQDKIGFDGNYGHSCCIGPVWTETREGLGWWCSSTTIIIICMSSARDKYNYSVNYNWRLSD